MVPVDGKKKIGSFQFLAINVAKMTISFSYCAFVEAAFRYRSENALTKCRWILNFNRYC